MKRLILLFTFLFLAACSTSEIQTSDIAIAGSFLNGGECNKYNQTGCDLFLVNYDFTNLEIISIEQITNSAGAEHFPALDPNSKFIIYSSQQKNKDFIVSTIIETKETNIIDEGYEPTLSRDGTILTYWKYVNKEKKIFIADVSFDNNQLIISNIQELSLEGDVTEPVIFPDNIHLSYYQKGDVHEGQTIIYNLETKEKYNFSEPNGCAHPSVNYDNTEFFCQANLKLYSRQFLKGIWSKITVLEYPKEKNPYYQTCDLVTFGHAEFCGNNDYIISIVGCNTESDLIEKMAILDLQGNYIAPLHTQIEEYYNVKNTESRSAVCNIIQTL